MKNIQWKKIFSFWQMLIVFTGLVVLTSSVWQLRMFLDDYVWSYPSILSNIWQHFKDFHYNFGSHRPLTTLCNYFIFSLYSINPGLPHFIGLWLQITVSLLTFFILKQLKIKEFTAFLISLFILFFPIATESYMWLVGIPSTIVIVIFLVEFWLLLTNKPSFKLLFWLFILHLISVFTYESTYFLIIPMMMLFWQKSRRKLSDKIIMAAFLILPNILWLASKIIWPAHAKPIYEIKMVDLNLIPYRISVWFETLFKIFFSQESLKFYWFANFQRGRELISPLTVVGLLIVVFIITWRMLFLRKIKKINHEPTGLRLSELIGFWLLAFMGSLLPNILIKETSFAFRTIYLPMVCGIFLLSVILQHLKAMINYKWLFITVKIAFLSMLIFFVIVFIPSVLGIANIYTKNYYSEIMVRDQIKESLEKITLDKGKVFNVYLLNFPHNMLGVNYNHGEWLKGCFNTSWCGQGMMWMVGGGVNKVTVISKLKGQLFDNNSRYLVFEYQIKNDLPYLRLIKANY